MHELIFIKKMCLTERLRETIEISQRSYYARLAHLSLARSMHTPSQCTLHARINSILEMTSHVNMKR